jgi:hypothetical protein
MLFKFTDSAAGQQEDERCRGKPEIAGGLAEKLGGSAVAGIAVHAARTMSSAHWRSPHGSRIDTPCPHL